MRSLWLLLLTGCEKMEEPGSLFAAVQVDAPAAIGVEGTQPESGSTFDFPELEVISSEDLQSGSSDSLGAASEEPSEEPEAAQETPDEATAVVEDEPTEAPEAAPDDIPEVVAAEAVAPPPVVTTPMMTQWPVRLVKTIPDTNPPRAILGLPSGEELVVSPGTMVPEHGLVVIAIGPSSAQLAQVTPQGDHAAVSPLTLQTMY